MCIVFLPDLWYNTDKEKNRDFFRNKVMMEGLQQFVKGGVYYE